jgi:hypothetical protein
MRWRGGKAGAGFWKRDIASSHAGARLITSEAESTNRSRVPAKQRFAIGNLFTWGVFVAVFSVNNFFGAQISLMNIGLNAFDAFCKR